MANQLEALIADIRKIHHPKALYAPIITWEEMQSLIAALEQSNKQCESWRQIAQTNISEREKDIAVLERKNNYIEKLREWNCGLAQESSVHQQRIAELEKYAEAEASGADETADNVLYWMRRCKELEASQLAVKLPERHRSVFMRYGKGIDGAVMEPNGQGAWIKYLDVVQAIRAAGGKVGGE